MKNNTKKQKDDSQQVNPLEVRVQELENQLKRALADYQNLQREHDREKQILLDTVRRSIFRDLIDLFTDLNIAVKTAQQAAGENPWLQGIIQIMQKYQDLLKNNGVTEITFAEGDPMDYNAMQIIGTLAQGTANTVAQTTEPGYKIGDYIISPAKVVVNTGIPATPKQDPAPADEPHHSDVENKETQGQGD